MKNINYLTRSISQFSLVILAVFAMLSCENEFEKDNSKRSTDPPVITSVSEAQEDAVVTQGVLEGTYIIRGENLSSLISVTFNGVEAGFNPALLTDNIVFVTVPIETPFVGQSNIMRLKTLGGVLDYDFPLLTIETFTEEILNDVKVVNLIGGDFTDASRVTFVSGSEEQGNLVKRLAEILSVSATKVTVAVPPGITQAFIFLETSRGAIAQSSSFGFSLSVYIDGLSSQWTTSEWGGTHDLAATDIAFGETSIKSVRDAWSGLTFLPTPNVKFTDFESITVQVYGDGSDGKIRIRINDIDPADDDDFLLISYVSGGWTKFVIPLSDFYPNGGAPDEINRIDFQEFSGTGLPQYIFRVDDFGFL